MTSPTNERTFVPYLLPRAAVGNSTPLIRVAPAAAGEVPALLAVPAGQEGSSPAGSEDATPAGP